MNKLVYLPLGVTILLSGCAMGPPPLYYWGNVPSTYHRMVLEPGDKSLLEHEQALKDSIRYSEEHGKLVPPGVHCELGYMQFKKGVMAEALNHYDAEVRLYPESKVFVDRLKDKVKEAQSHAKP
ncbi:MAG: hypothetical protein HW380_2966 [Magnetococcales bacterium]|nr:hypothetical protein [Magnetococcales bacterium]